MLSKRTWHCLEILVAMASVPISTTLTTQILAQRLGLSISHLESLMRQLREADLVRSFRGPGGGYGLARHAQQITVWDAVSQLEEPAPEGQAQAMLTDALEEALRTTLQAHLRSLRISDFARTDPQLMASPAPAPSGFRLGPMPQALRPSAPNSVFQLHAFLNAVAA